MMSKRFKAFAYEVLTPGQSHGEIRRRAQNAQQYFFGMWNPATASNPCSVSSLISFHSSNCTPENKKVLSPCRGSNHKFMLSFHFSSVEAIYMVSHDCTPISAHSNVSLTTRTLSQRSCGGVLLMEFKSSHVPGLILNIRRISLR